jgi:hypothetical protein
MPVNGHTSGVSVPGSDKKCAEQWEPRRRMRDWLCMKNYSRFAAAGKGQQRGGRCGQRREILLIKTRFRERLNRRASPLVGCCATSLVSTASRLTRLWARRIRHDARSGRQSNGRRKQRRDDSKTNRNPSEHRLIDSTPIASRPAGTVMKTVVAAAEAQVYKR